MAHTIHQDNMVIRSLPGQGLPTISAPYHTLPLKRSSNTYGTLKPFTVTTISRLASYLYRVSGLDATSEEKIKFYRVKYNVDRKPQPGDAPQENVRLAETNITMTAARGGNEPKVKEVAQEAQAILPSPQAPTDDSKL
ncbi:MAG: hypothetical protein LQ338_005998 [Usnochroma carphineum]|nr:MAG: hypothetical protein LQ338_005998 [Usnochroma carphineum]